MFREFLTIVMHGAIYLYVQMLLGLGLERWIRFFKRFTPLFWVSALAIVVGSASAIVAYHEIAFSYRYVLENGVSVERQGADRAAYVEQAKRAYYFVIAGISALTLGVSVWIGRRSSERAWPTIVAFIAIMSVYFAIALLYVEQQNACKVGTSFLIDQPCG